MSTIPNETISVTPSDLREVLLATYPIKRAVAIEGAPGGGKTSICRQVADEMGIGYIEVHMPTALVEDFGVPDITTKGATFGYKLPYWYPAKGSNHPKKGILCFDDRNQCNADIQKVAANIIQARTLHGTPMMDGWQVISTGNRVQDRAGANRVLSHLRNRETVYTLETNLDAWTEWAFDNGCHTDVIAFLQFRTEYLHAFDPSKDQSPTPRAWVEGVSPILGIIPPHTMHAAIAGAVGISASVEFMSYIKVRKDLPDIKKVLKDPVIAKLPEQAVSKYAMVAALVDHTTEKNIDKVFTYLSRFTNANGTRETEFIVLFMKMAGKRVKDIVTNSTYLEWCTRIHNFAI